MDCSLADEHVLMRSASLLWVECLWDWLWLPDPGPAWIWLELCRTGVSAVSPGKVKEPGRLAGEAGMELQKPDPDLCPGLGGGAVWASLPKAGVAMGEAIGETAPGRVFDMGVEGKGPTVARGIGVTALDGERACACSSEFGIRRLLCGLPPEGMWEEVTGRGDKPESQVKLTLQSYFFLQRPFKTNIICFIPDILLGLSVSAPGWWRIG